MHARELVELAALAACHGPALVVAGRPLARAAMEDYWTVSKCRLERWNESLHEIALASQGVKAWRSAAAQSIYVRAVLGEVLSGEVLARVWAAVVASYDRRLGIDENEPLAQRVLLDHLDARLRVLRLLAREPAIAAEDALALNHLRRRAERWSDLLVGHVAVCHDVSEFAVEPARARAFAADFRDQAAEGQYWPLTVASLRAAFFDTAGIDSPNGDLNGKIAAAVLACFDAGLFDSTGQPHSLWMARLTRVADETQTLIEQMFRAEAAPGGGIERLSGRGVRRQSGR